MYAGALRMREGHTYIIINNWTGPELANRERKGGAIICMLSLSLFTDQQKIKVLKLIMTILSQTSRIRVKAIPWRLSRLTKDSQKQHDCAKIIEQPCYHDLIWTTTLSCTIMW